MKLRLHKAILWALGLFLAIALQGRVLPAYSITPSSDRPPASDSVNARVSEIEQTWQAQYANYLGTPVSSAPLTAEQISQTLSRLTTETGHRLALIYVFPQIDKLELVLVIPEQPILRFALPNVSSQRLLDTVNTFQTDVARPIANRTFLSPAQQLYQWLIAPLDLQLQAHTIDTLIFCLGSGLRSLPLAALSDGQQFLAEKYSLGIIPAFSLTNSEHINVHNTQVLAMGASEFQGLTDLPAVPIELSAITQNLWQGQVFLNQDFTLDNLRKQLNTETFSIVHLATHAKFQPGAPDRSYIQLWQTDQLTLDDLRQFNWSELPVELLVLSACQTALGDRDAELGFAGLSFNAGVKSSLASLWYISDLGTLALMREFYWQLAQPEVTTKAEALRRTQLAMLHGQVRIENRQLLSSGGTLALPEQFQQSSELDFSAPYYWAAFTLVGSPW